MKKRKEDIAFDFGSVAKKHTFVNRSKEIDHLHTNYANGISSILISPRRWGKTSLVIKSAEVYKDPETKFVFMDAFRVKSEEEFLTEFTTQILKAFNSKVGEIMSTIKEFFKNVIPELALSADITNEMSFRLKWNGDNLPIEEILNLPEVIAKKKDCKVIICIDEFQNIATFDSKARFQKVLRSFWQHHKLATYCLYGSKRNLMVEFFNKSSMPFFRFGEIIFLEKIEKDHWVKHIKKQFKKHGKSITPEIAKAIPETMECHSYYVQQLAYNVYINTDEVADETVFIYSLRRMLEQNQILYRRQVEDLSYHMVQFLKAMIDGHKTFYSKKVMNSYDLGSVGNIKRIKEALESKEVIDTFYKYPEFLDPAFRIWFKSFYLDYPLLT